MRQFKSLLTAAVGIAAIAAQPAAAVVFNPVSYLFDFTGGNDKTTGANGNAITKTVGGITVTAAGWSIDKSIGTPLHGSGTVAGLDLRTAYIADYSSGLGVTDRIEDGSYPQHTVDNVGIYDFILLTFSQPVQLLFGALTPFAVNGAPANNAWVSFADNNAANAPLTNAAVWGNMMLHATEVSGNLSAAQDYVSYLNPGMNTGTQWIVGADAFDGVARDDGFKLSAFNVQTPVPEPGVWAMMMLGIGLAGAALRRRRAPATDLARA